MTDQRAEFVGLAQQPGANRRALCRAFGIAPTTGYKWLHRYAAAGAVGLQDRSRRPHRSPAQTSPAIERAVLALRAQHPHLGRPQAAGAAGPPGRPAAAGGLHHHGHPAAARPAGPRAGGRPAARLAALRTPLSQRPVADGLQGRVALWPGRCHPLTILDDHSRYALGLVACPNQRTATVRTHLVTAFQRYGVPDRLLVDNGSPWGNHPAHPYTPLTVWLRRLGIAVSHSRPYHPQTLGKDERFHGTLQRDLGRQPPRPDLFRLANHLRCLAPRVQPCAPPRGAGLGRPRQSLSRQFPTLPRPAAAAALRPRRSGPQSPGRRLGVLPGAPAPAAPSLARSSRRLSPDAHRRLLGHPLPDRQSGHTRSAGAGLGVHHVSEHPSTMCPVWDTPRGRGSKSGRKFEDQGGCAKVSTGRGGKSPPHLEEAECCATVSQEGLRGDRTFEDEGRCAKVSDGRSGASRNTTPSRPPGLTTRGAERTSRRPHTPDTHGDRARVRSFGPRPRQRRWRPPRRDWPSTRRFEPASRRAPAGTPNRPARLPP